jgi:hypothetical protein
MLMEMLDTESDYRDMNPLDAFGAKRTRDRSRSRTDRSRFRLRQIA